MRHVLAVLVFAASAFAQSNAVPGLDVRTYEVENVGVYGRRGGAHPNGEAGMSLGHSMCNSGTVQTTWTGGSFSGVMLPTYPKIATLIARESNGRMVQVSGKSFCKHSRYAYNFNTGPCMPCTGITGNLWYPGCSDTYYSGFSALNNLGPTDEIDPWLGTWNPVGSYFDRGDPAVSGPAAMDGVASPISSSDPLHNRMIVPESELVVPGTFYGQVHVVVIGEPAGNRGNNQTSRQLAFTWSGTSWTGIPTGQSVSAPVLTRWSGASTATNRNGLDDGHFMVGCKVTGPVDGFWHYEIAVQNIDNAAGAAALRVPVCPSARVRNAGFRDIDRNALNQWTVSTTSGEIAWLAAANNALDWNTIYNFWFDCDAAPIAGAVTIDRARLGPGALGFPVAGQVPGLLGSEYLGDGCGSPAPTLVANGLPSSPNAAYALTVQGAALAPTLLVLSLGGDGSQLGNGCVRFVDPGQVGGSSLLLADGAGRANWSLPVPAGLSPFDVFGQAAQLAAVGPLLGGVTLSNGVRIRVGGTGCP